MPALARAFAALTLANLIVFCGISLYLGGDALNGRIEAGRFYLAKYGRLTEVSQGVFLYSKFHAISVIIMVAAVLIWAGLIRWRQGKSS